MICLDKKIDAEYGLIDNNVHFLFSKRRPAHPCSLNTSVIDWVLSTSVIVCPASVHTQEGLLLINETNSVGISRRFDTASVSITTDIYSHKVKLH